MNSPFLQRLYSPDRPVIVFDGAMGTNLQLQNLSAEDFGGTAYEGCNEYLVITKPEAVQTVHRAFLAAGADVIETDTFGGSTFVLDEYGLGDRAYELNKVAAELAKACALEFSTPEKPRFVAGSIGPGTKLPTLGHIHFDTLKAALLPQVAGLMEGGADLLLIETCQDVLQIKAALNAVEAVFAEKNQRLPLMVSVTMEQQGALLVGSDITAVLAILEPYPINILGLNCATGPDLMSEHIKYLAQHSPFVVSCIPNAGLPENVGGQAHYRLTPIELRIALSRFVEDLGVQVIGGCCGTRPDHIAQLATLAQDLQPKPRSVRLNDSDRPASFQRDSLNYVPAATSLYAAQPYEQDNSFLIVGERLNASGSKACREMLNAEDWDGLVSLAKSQVKEGAHILDVNVDYVGRDGERDMREVVSRLVNNATLPLMLDSTEWSKMEAGLKVAGSKCLLNSTNYEDGEERFFKVLELAKHYGAGIVVGTIDEEGMARTAARKFGIAQRAYQDALNYGIPAYELFYDPLALPISTGIEEDRVNGKETIEAMRLIRENLPGVHIILGVSNISFGLSPAARITLNSMFLNEAMAVGLDSAIVSAAKILPLAKIDPKHQEVCRDLIYDRRRFDNGICVYDPLTELTKLFEGVTTQQARSGSALKDLPIEERLKQHIIDGERIGLDVALQEALEQYPPLQIINTFLLDGMKVVGELFGSGQMQLPFVLQSAETMKAAVAFLEPFMDKSEVGNNAKGTVVIATVKGDVHDIGKNLVDIILTNNGYRVINLGIKQPVDNIIQAYREHNADCIAMSGLLVKSTAFMKDNLETFNQQNITVPVILGGAALTPKFVYNDCQNTYNGQVIYGKDAFADLHFMDKLMPAKSCGQWDDLEGFLNSEFGIRSSEFGSSELEVRSSELGSSSEFGVRSSELGSSSEFGIRNSEFGSSELEVRSSELEVSSSEFGVRSSELEVSSSEFGVRSSEFGVRSSELEVSSSESGVSSLELEVQSAELEVAAETGLPALETAPLSSTNSEPRSRSISFGATPNPELDPNSELDPIPNSEFRIPNSDRPSPPFWGTKVLQPQDIPLAEVFEYLDLQALIVGQWQFRKPKDQSREDYDRFLAEKVHPILETWKARIIAENLLHPQVVYGYFPCQAEGEALHIYDPIVAAESRTHGPSPFLPLSLVGTFHFPRQKTNRRLCIADFFAAKDSGHLDLFPMQAVTVGEIATEYGQKLFANNQYTDYLYYHGLAVQTAEALAEWTHARIRRELGYGHLEPDTMRDVLQQRYQGSRYSFGYPACPNLQDQYLQLALLQSDRIGLTMDEHEQLSPEQSTTAIVAYHPAAKYFST